MKSDPRHAAPDSPDDLKIITILDNPESPVLRLSGTLDATTADELGNQLALVIRTIPKHLLFDLGQVDYISSMGLSVLLKTAVKLKAAGSECHIYDPQRSVRRVLEISKWDHLILDPSKLSADDPCGSYVLAEEPTRAERRGRTDRPLPPRLFRD
jgi:anti-anti-sigma factor